MTLQPFSNMAYGVYSDLKTYRISYLNIAAQEDAAHAQRAANYQSILQSLTPRAPINCTRLGSFTTCR